MKALLRKLQLGSEGGPVPDRWINNDIKPIEAHRRTWGFWTFHNYCTQVENSIAVARILTSSFLWCLGVLCNSNISSYMTGSSLIALGLTWWQAIIAIIIGQLIATALVVLNSLPGAFYHCELHGVLLALV